MAGTGDSCSPLILADLVPQPSDDPEVILRSKIKLERLNEAHLKEELHAAELRGKQSREVAQEEFSQSRQIQETKNELRRKNTELAEEKAAGRRMQEERLPAIRQMYRDLFRQEAMEEELSAHREKLQLECDAKAAAQSAQSVNRAGAEEEEAVHRETEAWFRAATEARRGIAKDRAAEAVLRQELRVAEHQFSEQRLACEERCEAQVASSEVHLAAMHRSEKQAAALVQTELHASSNWRSKAEVAEREAKEIDANTKRLLEDEEIPRQRTFKDQARQLSVVNAQLRALEIEREELQRKSASSSRLAVIVSVFAFCLALATLCLRLYKRFTRNTESIALPHMDM